MRGRIQTALSIVAFVLGLIVLSGRLLLDFEGYVTELEARAAERAIAGEAPRPRRLSAYQARRAAAVLASARVDVGDAALIWAAWDLESDDGTRFRRELKRLARADGWIAWWIVWLNDGRIEDVQANRLEQARERATPKLEALDPEQTQAVRTLWDEIGADLSTGVLDILERMAQARAEALLVELEDRVRSSLRGELLPTEDDMRAWMQSREDASSCVLSYVPMPDHYRGVMRVECPGADEVGETIRLPRLPR